MKKLFLVAMLCLTFAIPAKADFWKKMKNAILGPGGSTSSSNTSGKTGGTRGYLTTNENGTKIIVNPFDKNAYKYEDRIYEEERNSTYMHRNLQGSATKVDYVECKIKPGNFLNQVGYSSFYGYIKFPVYKMYNYFWDVDLTVFGCFSRDKTGKEKEISGNTDSIYLDHELAMYIWDNQLTVTTLSMKNGKVENGKLTWFDSTNPEAEIYINGEKFK